MLLDMALGSVAPTSFQHRCRMTATLLLIVCVTLTKSAPTTYDEIQAKRTDLADYFNDPNGCYYNYDHYEEGDRIVTNEPCLNCTCHNRMLMCYLRVCPFSKAIGQDCTVQKSPDQCCPVISCPEVPVHLLTSSTTQMPTTTTTEIGWHDNYGCMMNENEFFPDGAQVPSNPEKPCELCYCIRNRTACVMQECTLHVEGCRPVYQDGVCCPVRYDCDYENEKYTTSAPKITGGLVFSTTSAPFDCRVNEEVYRDGESIAMVSEKPCEHCYCMRGDIVCAVQDCGEPLRGKDCTPETPPAGQCCPTSYQCANETINSEYITTLQPTSQSDSDENEAEKYPSNEDVYNKLGEKTPSHEDDTNDVDSDHIYTTSAYNNELSHTETSDQTTNKDEEIQNVVPDNNHNVVGEPNTLPASDSSNKINEETKQDIPNTKPELTNPVPIGIESDQNNHESTNKPVKPTLVDEVQPTHSPSLNEDSVNPTIYTPSDKNNNMKTNEENPSQSDVTSNLPIVSTDNSIESQTQSSNLQDNQQEEIKQQTDTPSVIEKEPIKSNNNEQMFNENQDPQQQNNEESTINNTNENKIQTISPLNEDIELTTQKLTQYDTEKTSSEDPNTQTDPSSNIEPESPDQSNKDITQIPQEDISQTENPSNVDKNQPNDDKSQLESTSSTEIPKVENKPIEQNEPLVENNSQSEIKPESQNTQTEQNQDNAQSENVSPTEIPKVENEPIEQNSLPVENQSLAETQPESQNTPTEQTQNNVQAENSPTEIPKLENEPTEQNNLQVENKPQDETQPESQNTPTEQNQYNVQAENVSPTEIPNVENEPIEQNNLPVETKPQVETQTESENIPTEQNQDSLQSDNISPTEIPVVENEPIEENKPLVENNMQTENKPESQQTSTEHNQDSPQVENISPTEIPKVENEPTEQNKLQIENKPQDETQPESQDTPIKQNQDNAQAENVSPTEIPKVENEPIEQNNLPVENIPQAEIETQPESENIPTEQNQDNLLTENVSPTEIPKVENDPTEQNNLQIENKPQDETQPESQNTPTEQNQYNVQAENASPTEIPKVENEPIEQNNSPVETKPQVEIQTESENIPTEQNQNSLQSDNTSPTEIPVVENAPIEQNKPLVENNMQTENKPESQQTSTENNQDSPQVENISPTEIPKVENEPTEQNKPLLESNSQSEIQPESQNTPTEQNQDSQQVDNVSSTEIPKTENQSSPQNENIPQTEIPNVVNESIEQNNPLVDSHTEFENQPEFQQTSTEQNQDSPQVEIISSTEISIVENESVNQNKPQEENNLQSEIPESQNIPTEQNQDSQQVNNLIPTEIPKTENQDGPQSENISPTEQAKPLVENNTPTVNKLELEKKPIELNNQDNPQTENVSSTEIPEIENNPTEQDKPLAENSSHIENEPESQTIPTEQNQDSLQEDIISSTEIPSKQNELQSDNILSQSIPNKSENDVSTEHSIEDHNIYVVSPTSPPLFSENQVKGEDSTSIINENDNNNKYPTEINSISENSQPSLNDKTSSAENINTNNIPTISSTEIAPGSYNETPQTNDDNEEHSIETKPIKNDVNSGIPNDVTNSPINSHEQESVSDEHNDNRFGSNKPVNSKPVTTETNYVVNSETTIQSILVDENSSQGNHPINEHSVGEEITSIPNADSVASQTETPVETDGSTNEYPSSVDENVNDVTTFLPQHQEVVTPVRPEATNPSEPIKTIDETKTPNDMSENSTPENLHDSYVPTEINVIQNSDEIIKPTESLVLDPNNTDQSVSTQTPEKNNEFESATSHEQSQHDNVNEIIDQMSVQPDISSDDKNNLNIVTESNQNIKENVTPLSDKIETGTNVQDSDEKPVKITNEVVETESTSISQPEPDNPENSMTTTSYIEIPSVVPTTNGPISQSDQNESSTEYTADDSISNSPIQESPNMNVNHNEETSTNSPSHSEIPNKINQDSTTEFEIYGTQTPTEKNILSVNSNNTPDNDEIQETITNLPDHTKGSEINANEIVDEKSSDNPQNVEQPSVSKTPDYVIDITTFSSTESTNNEETTTNNDIDKNSDVTTVLYEDVQSGVPGEGSCLIDFVTYAHKAEVPKINPCHEKCECLNSIVTCTSVNCPPAPPQHKNCIPLHPGNESWCCPTYMCEGGFTDNQPGSLISTVLLEDKPSEENDEKIPIDEEVPSTSSPQSVSEFSTLAPIQTDTNSDGNSQDSVDVTKLFTQTEIPSKQDSASTNYENNTPVTTNNLEMIDNENEQSSENEKLGDSNKPNDKDQISGNEEPVYTTDKPEEIDHSSESQKPEKNNEPTDSDQSTENPEKPIDSLDADFTTVSYITPLKIVTNKPDTLNEEQNTLSNIANESQDYPAPSTEVSNYESTITNTLLANDQNQSELNSELNNLNIATTFKPNDSVLNQGVDDNISEEVSKPTINVESNTKLNNYVTDIPESDVNPTEVNQTPTIVADTKPLLIENNSNGLRPSSIDDIISSVNMVKDAVKNSLETSSKSTVVDYQTTIETSSLSEDTLPNNEPQSVSSVNVTPESQTVITDEQLTDHPTITELSGEVVATQIPNLLPSENADQGVSTDLPLYIPIKQEIPINPNIDNANINPPEEIIDDITPEVTTQYLPISDDQDLTSNGPETSSNSVPPQVNVESYTNLPNVVVNDKTPEVTTQVLPSLIQQEVLTDNTVNKPSEEQILNTDSPILSNTDVNADNTPIEVVSAQAEINQPPTDLSTIATSDNNERFGESSSSSTPSHPVIQEDKRPQESGDVVPIPFDTEKPSLKPSSSTPLTPHKPSYTSMPQTTWTQKPFHHDSTSEPPQPDQGFPDEYDDENEAVYGPGTCRYGGKIYVSAQQVPRDDPCDFCFCFRGDIICLQQSCPPPIFGCYQENINGFCCPRYECPVAQATSVNITTTTTTTTTMVPPNFPTNAYRGAARRTGCLIHGHAYKVGEDVGVASTPCLECICRADGNMKCNPKPCSPEPLLRKMMAEAVDEEIRR